MSSVYKVRGSIHDQILTEGAAEVVSEASAEVSIVAQNIDAVLEVANAIPDDMSGIPDAVAEANAAATRAETAAASAVGIDTAAQGYANAAASSAAVAVGAVDTIEDLLENAGTTIDQITDAVTDAEAAAELARRWANEAPAVPVEADKYSALHYASATEVMLASAPNMQARVVAGTDPGFSNVAADFGRAIVVQRAASTPVTLTLAPTLFAGPPKPDADLALAPLYIINNSGTGSYIEVVGPGTGSTVIKPTLIATDTEIDATTTPVPPDENHVLTIDIPAGTDRLAVVLAGVISHTTPAGGPTLTCGVGSSTVTQRGTAGNGNQAGSQPILATLWTVALPAAAALPGATLTLAVPAGMSSLFYAVRVFQNVGGTEDYAVTLRAGAATSETQAFSPSQPGSTNVVFAFHQGGAANPVAIAPSDSILQGRTGTRAPKDFSYALALDEDHAASAETYTGSSAASSPAVIGGLVLLPVTTAGGGSGDGMIWKGTRPCRVQPGEHAAAWASSDGTTYFLSYVPNP